MKLYDFTFEADLDLNEYIVEDIEAQIVEEVKNRYGQNKTGDDIEDFIYSLVVKVKVRDA